MATVGGAEADTVPDVRNKLAHDLAATGAEDTALDSDVPGPEAGVMPTDDSDVDVVAVDDTEDKQLQTGDSLDEEMGSDEDVGGDDVITGDSAVEHFG